MTSALPSLPPGLCTHRGLHLWPPGLLCLKNLPFSVVRPVSPSLIHHHVTSARSPQRPPPDHLNCWLFISMFSLLFLSSHKYLQFLSKCQVGSGVTEMKRREQSLEEITGSWGWGRRLPPATAEHRAPASVPGTPQMLNTSYRGAT